VAETQAAGRLFGDSLCFEGRDGITLRGDAWGPAEGRPVLLLHGGGQTRHSWAGCGRRLGAEGWRAIALDMRGHGESGWSPAGDYLPGHFVDDLRVVARALEGPPVVVGASLGGITGLLAEGESEARVLAGLVLVDVTPRIEMEGVTRIVEFMLSRPDGFASLEEAADAVASYRRHRSRPRDLSGLRKNLRRGEDGRYRWHWDPRFLGHGRPGGLGDTSGRAFTNPHRLLDAARALEVPTLLVRGRESDVVGPRGVEEFLEAVPHARFVDVTGAGHMVAGDRNDVFTEAVVEFLREAAF
jgi:pimeloyl-ACP methyl ester carboxylesterase